MIPVFQTKFTKLTDDDPPQYITRGNCHAACLASLLECKISDLPPFEELPDDGSWYFATLQALDKYDLDFSPCHVSLVQPYYAIGYGKSPRGNWGHSCVYFNGKLLHDPYPHGGGLTRIDGWYVLTPLERNEISITP